MYINSAISHLHGWKILKENHKEMKQEIEAVIKNIHLQYDDFSFQASNTVMHRSRYDWRQLGNDFDVQLRKKGMDNPDRNLSYFDGIMDGVGIDFFVGQTPHLLSRLFVTYPTLLKSGRIRLPVFLVPEKAIANFHAVNIEQLRTLLSEVKPLSINYPFVILGVGIQEKEFEVEELTSALDQYLIETTGRTLQDNLFIGENELCEFKQDMSDRPERIAKEVCAFANNRNGGLILFGITDDRKVQGIDNASSDKEELRITDIIRNTCNPAPEFIFKKFEVSNGKIILVLQIFELEQKPCMHGEKVFVRVGSTSRSANSFEIRKLILA